MVKLRLKRMGRKKQPFYRIVAIKDTAPRDGHVLDEVGFYDPLHARAQVDAEAALRWLERGAQMSDTVHALFKHQGILARRQGLEGRAREDALKGHKPARRRKLASSAPEAEETSEETLTVEETSEESAESAQEQS